MNVCSYGPIEPHLWLVSKIATGTWDDCRFTSERMIRTHAYDDLVDLLFQVALRGRMTPIWKNSSKDTWVEVLPLPLNVAKEKGPKLPLTPRGEVTCVP